MPSDVCRRVRSVPSSVARCLRCCRVVACYCFRFGALFCGRDARGLCVSSLSSGVFVCVFWRSNVQHAVGDEFVPTGSRCERRRASSSCWKHFRYSLAQRNRRTRGNEPVRCDFGRKTTTSSSSSSFRSTCVVVLAVDRSSASLQRRLEVFFAGPCFFLCNGHRCRLRVSTLRCVNRLLLLDMQLTSPFSFYVVAIGAMARSTSQRCAVDEFGAFLVV
jgi:hypothetical protein